MSYIINIIYKSYACILIPLLRNLISLQVVSQARMEDKATNTEVSLQQATATNSQKIPSVLEKYLQEKETEYDGKVKYYLYKRTNQL